MKKLAFIAAYVLLVIPCAARIITVDGNGPADFNTIQAAINDANEGDTVVVAPGTYTGTGNRDIEFLGKAITVRSVDPYDPCVVAATIIDCNGTEMEPHKGFYFYYGEDSNSVLAGLTITNGYEAYGGAISCYTSSPTITCCTLTANTVSESGGGIDCNESSPTISNCTFTNNDANSNGGGMFNFYESSPTVTNCTFTGNSTVLWDGGGILNVYGSSPKIIDCVFSNNTAGQFGGAVANIFSSNAILQDCTITENSAIWTGGGIFCHYSSPAVHNCTFTGNSADGYGGGMYNTEASSPTVTNCTFTGNSAVRVDGGGILNVYGSNAVITNCLFSNNTAEQGGGGAIASIADSNAIIQNCTIAENSAFWGGGVLIYLSDVTVNNSIIWFNSTEELYIDGSLTAAYSNIHDFSGGSGNIDADPCFVDVDANDFHLLPGSPSVNTADPAYIPEPNETDIDGQVRVISGRLDMGADEFNPFRTAGDMTGDGLVDFYDLAILIDQWLQSPGNPSADIAPSPAGDHIVNFIDFAALAQNWLNDLTE